MLPIMNVAVTGGAGNIAYSLLFRIASGELFGKEQPISLRILEIEESFSSLEGVRMELEDCAYPLLQEIIIDTDPYSVFSDSSIAFLVGAKPRGPGMERKDLLCTNAAIFQKQAMVLNAVAKRDAHILIIGNPCNTNCLIALHNAPNLNPKRFYAMTRLDENRARALLAKKRGCLIQEVSTVPIWGNHSNTQVPDFYNATIQGIPAIKAIEDEKWFLEEFTSMVQNRGTAIIQARGKSSAASAASSALDAMKSICSITEPDDFFSMGVYTADNSYTIDRDLVFSFPCRTNEKDIVEIVSGMYWNEYLENKIRITEKELQQEREIVKEML